MTATEVSSQEVSTARIGPSPTVTTPGFESTTSPLPPGLDLAFVRTHHDVGVLPVVVVVGGPSPRHLEVPPLVEADGGLVGNPHLQRQVHAAVRGEQHELVE